MSLYNWIKKSFCSFLSVALPMCEYQNTAAFVMNISSKGKGYFFLFTAIFPASGKLSGMY